jgi:hypothetical protein
MKHLNRSGGDRVPRNVVERNDEKIKKAKVNFKTSNGRESRVNVIKQRLITAKCGMSDDSISVMSLEAVVLLCYILYGRIDE